MFDGLKKGLYVLLFFVAAFFIMRAFPWRKEAPARSAEPGPIVLDNGLKVILAPNPSSLMFASTAVILAGVIHEDAETNGAAHYLEHMLFNGTTRRTQKELYDEVDSLGAYNNAFTRDTYTCFQFLASNKHAAQALDIQSDMIFNSILPREKFTKEKGIVKEEIHKDASRSVNLVSEAFRARLFAGTPLSRSALGTEASIEGMPYERLMHYYKRLYVPNNTILLLMGNFEPDAMLAEVKKTFGAFARGEAPSPARGSISWPSRPTLVHKKIESAQITHLNVGLPAPPTTSPDCVPYVVLSTLLNGGFRTGLKERLAQAGVDVLSAGSSYETRPGELSCHTLSLEIPNQSDPEAALKQLAALLAETASKGVMEDEVESVTRSLVAEEIYNLEKPHYYGMFKANLMAAAPYALFDGYEKLLKSCTAEQVNAAARKYLTPGLHSMMAMAAGPGLQDLGERPFELELPDLTGGESKGKVIFEKKTLENGLTLAVAQQPDARVFSVHVLLKNRSQMEPKGKEGLADFVHRLLPRGTMNRERSLIDQELDEMGAHLKVTDNAFIPFDDYYFSPEFSYVRFETLRPYWEKGVRLLADLLFNPAFEPSQVEEVRSQMLVALQRDEKSPSNVSQRLLMSQWLADGPGTRPIRGTSTSVGSITRKDIEKFHRDYFNPSNMIVSVVGGVPMETLEPLVAKTFTGPGSDTQARRDPTAVPKVKAELPSGRVVERANLGQPQAYIYVGIPLPITRKNYAAAYVVNSLLSTRFAFELREKRGLAYSIGSSLFRVGSGDDNQYMMAASMGTSKDKLEEAEAGLREELKRLLSEPPDDKELTTVKNKLIGRQLMRALSSEQRAYKLGLAALRGESRLEPGAWIEEIEAVTLADVSSIANLLPARPGSFVAIAE